MSIMRFLYALPRPGTVRCKPGSVVENVLVRILVLLCVLQAMRWCPFIHDCPKIGEQVKTFWRMPMVSLSWTWTRKRARTVSTFPTRAWAEKGGASAPREKMGNGTAADRPGGALVGVRLLLSRSANHHLPLRDGVQR